MGKCLMPQVFVIGGGSGDEPIGDGDYLVRFIDYDGTILKQKRVDSGGSVTAPVAPTHDNLTFQEWNGSSANVTSNLDIRATYITTDGKVWVGLKITTATTLDTTLYYNKSDGSTLSIDWGDGSAVETDTASGNSNKSHTYSTAGSYIVKMWISVGSGTYTFGNGSNTTTFVGGNTQTDRDALQYVFIGNNVTSIGDYAFFNCYSLTNITIPNGVANIYNYAFKNCYSLTSITIPNSVISIGTETFFNCYSLTNITIPNGVANIYNYAFFNCYSLTNITIPNGVANIYNSAFKNCCSLTSITIPNSVISIGTETFSGCYSLTTYVFERTSGITTIGGTNTFFNANSTTKIYVPDDLVDDYKIADNWSTYADYIYPISEKGVTHND
jgi:hypothetical protein